jgi:hypothetical protein
VRFSMLWQDPFELTRSDRAAGRISTITWNTRRGIYESEELAHERTPSLGTFTLSVVAFTAIWSLCELPLEVLSSRTPLESAACIAGKVIWLCLTLCALSGSRAAKAAFVFCCGVSTFSIATGLAAEQQFFAVGFCLLAVECALKAAAFILIVWPAVRRVVQ